MLIQHLNAVVISHTVFNRYTDGLISWEQFNALNSFNIRVLEAVGIIAFPLFCFLLVEGFCHSKKRGKYLGSLLLFAVISELPFDLAFYHVSSHKNGTFPFFIEHQNVFFTLFLGLFCLLVLDYISHWDRLSYTGSTTVSKTKKAVCNLALIVSLTAVAINVNSSFGYQGIKLLLGVGVLLLVCLITLCIMGTVTRKPEKTNALNRWKSFFLQSGMILGFSILAELTAADYGGRGIILIVGLFLLRKNRWMQMLFCLCIYFTLYGSFVSKPFVIIALVLLLLYNGKRGNIKAKYAFYWFYPVHLMLLYGLALWLE